MRRYWSPRWLYKNGVVIGGTSEEDLPSPYFRNISPYPFEVQWMSITGPNLNDDEGDFSTSLGGAARRLRFSLGFTHRPEVNLAFLSGTCLMAHAQAPRRHFGYYDIGAALKLDRPYVLAADSGFTAKVYNYGLMDRVDRLSLLINGYKEPEGSLGPRNPCHFGAVSPPSVAVGAQIGLDNGDLQNDGRTDATITEIILGAAQKNAKDSTAPGLFNSMWMINPTTGPLWMEEPDPIPVGNLCPFNRAIADADDDGPFAYRFPPGTIMEPRQRLDIDVRNLADTAQAINICLFGYLEVS